MEQGRKGGLLTPIAQKLMRLDIPIDLIQHSRGRGSSVSVVYSEAGVGSVLQLLNIVCGYAPHSASSSA